MSKNDDEVLVRVEGVSKKFCRSLKKSLWYGVCDIAGELLPGRKRESQRTELTTKHTNFHEMGIAGGNQLADSAEFLEGHSQAGLQMDSEKLASIRSANESRASGEQTGSDSSSVLISEISGKKSSPALDSGPSTLDSTHGLRAGEFFAVKDVSFELRRGECLGLIGHNGAGNQAAGQPLVRLPQAARRVRRRGKARINMTLLKMLNGLIKPDAGTITMRGRVASWSMQKTPQANGAHFRSTLGSGRSTPLPINGSVLGLTKTD